MINKLMKLFRSRFFLGAFCILIKFAQLIVVFALLYKFFLPIKFLGWAFHFAMLLYLINRDEIPELKMPWLIILFLFPVIGAFVFMLLSSNNTSRKKYASFERNAQDMKRHQHQTEAINHIAERDSEAFAQANYLFNSAKMPCRDRSRTIYYSIGEDFHSALLDELEKAEHFIMMEYFIVQEGKMWDSIHGVLRKKAAQDVEVFVMYDDFGCMATLPDDYYKQLINEGIQCVPSNKFTPVISHIHNNRDHRKITVIDGKVGFTGGINLADEYINAVKKYGHWKDTAVKIEGEAVKNLTMLFISNWNTQNFSSIECDKYMNMPTNSAESSGFVIPFGDSPPPIDSEDIGKTVYLNMIYNAKKYLYITTPYLICDRELMNALRTAAKRGVDVRIITPHIPDKKTVFLMTRSNYKVLIDDGVKIYEYMLGFIHAKNYVCDDKFAVCGTINMDYRSFIHHFECGVWMYDSECIPDMKADFLNTMAISKQISTEQARLRGLKRMLAEVMKVFSPLL